ncbi:hypothetical protein BC6307_04995 [Sutcliffiella cohnii]|uniref:Uncharacterized protein n=1 Tax=Sutcliffiella cohnii TaxID=33932 RepID=A0A223KMV0_9BACI|nr:hypothetical protein BC6307_04995 [Sutcliffiella cohnii]
MSYVLKSDRCDFSVYIFSSIHVIRFVGLVSFRFRLKIQGKFLILFCGVLFPSFLRFPMRKQSFNEKIWYGNMTYGLFLGLENIQPNLVTRETERFTHITFFG